MKQSDANYHLRVDGKNVKVKEEALKPIRDWCAAQDKTTIDSASMKSLTGHMQAMAKKFLTLVRYVLHYIGYQCHKFIC